MVVRVDQLPGEVVGEERAPRERRDASVNLGNIGVRIEAGRRVEGGRSAWEYGWGGDAAFTRLHTHKM